MEATTKESLLELIGKIAEEQKYVDHTVDLKDINSGGANITSGLVLATVTAEGKDDLNLFAKVALLNEAMRKSMPMACPITTELYFYSTLLKQFEKVQERHDVPHEHRVIFPKVYGWKDEYLQEIIVLENLVKQGYETHDRLKSIDLEYASEAIELMANFHALSFACNEDDPEHFREILEKMTYDYSEQIEILQAFKDQTIQSVYEITAEEYKDKFEKFLEPKDGTDRFIQFLGMSHSKKPRMLVHGDFKASNLMHKRRNGKLVLLPVDFQLVHNAGPMVDIMYFLFTAADEEFRRKHYHELLDLYYEKLQRALQRFHVDPEKVYPEESYRKELKENEMLGLMIGIVLLPMIVVDEEQLPAAADMADIAVPSSQVYRERFNGILKNYVEWGLL